MKKWGGSQKKGNNISAEKTEQKNNQEKSRTPKAGFVEITKVEQSPSSCAIEEKKGRRHGRATKSGENR